MIARIDLNDFRSVDMIVCVTLRGARTGKIRRVGSDYILVECDDDAKLIIAVYKRRSVNECSRVWKRV